LVVINPIILDALKKFVNENSDIPNEMENLVVKLLGIEKNPSISREGIDRLYDQVLGQFADKKELVEWSKKYVEGN
jgi:hypothetical protein